MNMSDTYISTRTILPNGQVFVTYQALPTDEVYGWREASVDDKSIIKGSGGWWRTKDAQQAILLAHQMVWFAFPQPA